MRLRDYFLVPFVMDACVSMSMLLVNLRAQDLDASTFQLGLIGFAWGLPFAVFSALSARTTAGLNRRGVLFAGALLTSAAVIGYAVAAAPFQMILAAPLGGLGAALFWPTFETLLHDTNSRETHRRMGFFNVGWTLGIMTGSAAAGYLYALAPGRAIFVAVAGVVLADGVFLVARTPAGRLHEPDGGPGAHDPVRPSRRAYLRMAWVANFTLWYASSACSTIFPKLARSVGLHDGPIGTLLALVMVAQTLCFVLASRSARWHYRTGPIVAMQVVSGVGLGALVFGSGFALFGVGLALVGFGRGLTYTASLYYGLEAGGPHGNTGTHEAIIGASFVAAPFFSGLVAHVGTLRTPFLLAIAVIAVGVSIETVQRLRMPVDAPEEAPPVIA